MKNLVAKAGAAAAGSVLISLFTPIRAVQAFQLFSSDFGSYAESGNGLVQELNLESSKDTRFVGAGAIEAGEFLNGGESRGYVEFDLSSVFNKYSDPDQQNDFIYGYSGPAEFTLGFNVFLKSGSGTAGSSGAGENSYLNIDTNGNVVGDGSPNQYSYNTAADGEVNVFLYQSTMFGGSTPSSLEPLDPFPPVVGAGIVNPFSNNPFANYKINELSEGERKELDVTSLVQLLYYNYMNDPNLDQRDQYLSFGLMFDFARANEGICGTTSRECRGVSFNNFDLVPTPAAILPTLFGLASAAIRKKRNQFSGNDAE